MTMQPEIVERLDDLTDLIETAKALPLSQSCMVPRAEMLDLIDDARASLPESVLAAEQVLIRRDQILADAQADADRLVGGGAGAHESQHREWRDAEPVGPPCPDPRLVDQRFADVEHDCSDDGYRGHG